MPKKEQDDTRVGPPVDCVAPTGSTAEQQMGAVIAAERTEPTSGPWTREIQWADDIDDKPFPYAFWIADAEDIQIASHILSAADAHLIAAAPELLAALKALTQDSRFNLVIGGNPNAVDALVKQVDTAIAKAEGR